MAWVGRLDTAAHLRHAISLQEPCQHGRGSCCRADGACFPRWQRRCQGGSGCRALPPGAASCRVALPFQAVWQCLRPVWQCPPRRAGLRAGHRLVPVHPGCGGWRGRRPATAPPTWHGTWS